MTPTYRSSGNAKHYATPGYKRSSTLGGRFTKPATAWDLIKLGMPGGLWLTAGALVPFFAIIAFSGA